ncbi:hypothetical protein RND81_09G174200 [Saponaria officinalis]|uniref:Uncharacterized protein n=1 Tax=Saponaria officinalis TaxID=3572 RepID=A0AAW1ILZ6_SAPOF
MESLVNKKVRLRNCDTKTTLVAFCDKKSVISVDVRNNHKLDNSVWVIKSEHPYEAVQFESIYGTLLVGTYSRSSAVFQIDRSTSHDNPDKYRTWWILKDIDVNKNKINCVQTSLKYESIIDDYCLYLDIIDSCARLVRKGYSNSFDETCFYWDIEIVETNTVEQGRIIYSVLQPKSGHNPQAVQKRVVTNQRKVMGRPEHNQQVVLERVENDQGKLMMSKQPVHNPQAVSEHVETDHGKLMTSKPAEHNPLAVSELMKLLEFWQRKYCRHDILNMDDFIIC